MKINKFRWLITAVFICSVVAACGGAASATPQEDGVLGLPPVAVIRAREVLAADLQVGIETVTIESYSRQEWGDSCLGLGGPAESCLAAVYPGWQVMLQVAGDDLYEVRTDEFGGIFRINK
jgi:hypothetical protein